MKKEIGFEINGNPTVLAVDGDRMLLWVLRQDLGLTSVKHGCGEGQCGACTVLINNEAVRSCQIPVKDIEGKEVATIEALSQHGGLHPLQQAFIDHHLPQCGFCTPGMILSAYALLLKNPSPNREQIIEAMEGNLCRCGTYSRIIQAIHAAANKTVGASVR